MEDKIPLIISHDTTMVFAEFFLNILASVSESVQVIAMLLLQY